MKPLIFLVALVALALTACSPPKQPVQTRFEDFPGLISAIQSFSQDLKKRGQPLPPSVPLSDLVNRGYISSNSVRAFEGAETRIWLSVNPKDLNLVLMSARMPDGTVSAALADGSVQQFSSQRFEEQLKKTGQTDTGTSGGPGTNAGPR